MREPVGGSVRGDAGGSAGGDGVLHDRWLRALRAPDATVSGTRTELRAFAQAVAEWTLALTREEDAEYRLLLRLEEPAFEGGEWFVRYLLQSQADRSLLVAAEVAWKKATLRRPLMEVLGRAARASERIDGSLREQRPEGFALDDAGAHAFLTEEAPQLEGAGLGILLPSWWTNRGTQLRLGVQAHAKASKAPSAGFRLDTIVAVNWKIALGEETLTARELAELARLKAPLVRLRGQWVVVESADIRAALELRERRAESMRLGDLMRLSLTGEGSANRLPIADVVASGELGKVLDRFAGRAAFEQLPPPSELRATLRPYQTRGYSWLHFLSRLGLGAALADDMGLGKTMQTLALVARDWAEGVREPVLLVCPTSVIGNWQREAARFVPDLPLIVHHGAEREREQLLPKRKKVALVVTSYGILQRDLAALQRVAWRGIVLDEAQNVKNPESKQAKAARALAGSYRIALTGTPIENHVGDLWSLMEFLNPGLLGTNASFRREFLIPIATTGDRQAEARLKALTSPFVLRRLKSDPSVIADLPKKLEMTVFCQLTKEQASLYAAVLRDVEEQLEDSDGMSRRGIVLATLTKLKQICNHPANLLHDDSPLAGRSGKLARLAEMLEEVRESGDRALVFTQFTEMAAMIKRYLQETTGREVLYLHGGTGKAERDRMVSRFQEAPDAPSTFVLSLRAGGTGLNLTRANHVFHFDRWWNPAVENQASDRAYRIGQTKNVQVHRLVCAGTFEEQIDALLARKNALATRLVRSGEAGLTELSNEALREIFALRADAIGGD
jgi:SNF2 family DNA or RNA helicase